MKSEKIKASENAATRDSAETPDSAIEIPKYNHKGHRQRMKLKLDKFGPEIFTDHELLEMLLYYSVPQRNTNDEAHELIRRFGSPRKAIEADPQIVAQINGLKDNTTRLFALITEIYRRDRLNLPTSRRCFDSLSSVGEFFVQYYARLKKERFCMLLLDGSMRMTRFIEFPSGSTTSSAIDIPNLVRTAVIENAANVIIAHNHPSGNALPSNADREVTSRVESALTAVEITLVEHIIVGEVGYTPTMQIRLSSLRSPSASNNLDEGFLKRFYNS